MKLLGGAVLLAVVLGVSGCASNLGAEYELMTSDVAADSTPGFVAEPQTEQDVIEAFDVSRLGGLDPDSTRYQGVRDGYAMFLAVQGENSVYFVGGEVGAESSWGAGGGTGNTVMGFEPIEGGPVFQYLPHGTGDLPDGWSALSEWVAVQD